MRPDASWTSFRNDCKINRSRSNEQDNTRLVLLSIVTIGCESIRISAISNLASSQVHGTFVETERARESWREEDRREAVL